MIHGTVLLDKGEMRYHRSDRQYFSLRGETSGVEAIAPCLATTALIRLSSCTECDLQHRRVAITNKEET